MSEQRRLWCSLHHSFWRDCSACVEADYADLERQLTEAQGKLLAIKGRLLEIVEECEEIGEDPSYLFSMLDAIDPKILEPITEILAPVTSKEGE